MHEWERVNCPECDKSFVFESTLKKHIDAVHEKKKPHMCVICSKITLNKHKQMANEKNLNKCEDYEKAFKEAQDLKDHSRIAHGGKRVNRPEWDKLFVSK